MSPTNPVGWDFIGRAQKFNQLPRCAFRWENLTPEPDHKIHICGSHKGHSRTAMHKCNCGVRTKVKD